MNLQYWTEQVGRDYAEINEWPSSQRISAPGVLVQIFVLVESVHYERGYLKHFCSRSLPRYHLWSITMLANCTLHTPVSSPMCASHSPKRFMDSLAFTLLRASLVFPWILSTLDLSLGLCLCHTHWAICQLQLNMDTLRLSVIHSLTQLASCGLASVPILAWVDHVD